MGKDRPHVDPLNNTYNIHSMARARNVKSQPEKITAYYIQHIFDL